MQRERQEQGPRGRHELDKFKKQRKDQCVCSMRVKAQDASESCRLGVGVGEAGGPDSRHSGKPLKGFKQGSDT